MFIKFYIFLALVHLLKEKYIYFSYRYKYIQIHNALHYMHS